MDIKNIINAYRNPYSLLEQLTKDNPQSKRYTDLLKQGYNHRDLFYKLCQQRGINPDDILKQLK